MTTTCPKCGSRDMLTDGSCRICLWRPLGSVLGSVSDTPRTNWREARSEGLHDEWCFSFCRQLERELNDLNEQLHKVRIRCSEWAEVAGKHGAEVDRLRALLDSQNVKDQPTNPAE